MPPMPDERGEMGIVEAFKILGDHCVNDKNRKIRAAFATVSAGYINLLADNDRLVAENADLREQLENLVAVPELKIVIPKGEER